MARILRRFLLPEWKNVLLTFLLTVLVYYLQVFWLIPESKRIIDEGVNTGNRAVIQSSCIAMIILTVAIGLLSLGSSYTSAKASADFSCRLRRGLFRKINSFSPQDFEHFGEATLLTRTTTDVAQLLLAVLNGLRLWLIVPVLVTLELVMMARINLTVFLIMLVFIAGTVAALIWLGLLARERFVQVQKRVDRINLIMRERIVGTRPIRAFVAEQNEDEKTIKANQSAFSDTLEANRRINFLSPAGFIVINWAIVLIYLVGSYQIKNNMAGVSDLLLIFQYVSYCVMALSVIPFFVSLLPKISVSSMRIMEILDYEGSDRKNESSQKIPEITDEGGIEIEFRHVSFGYRTKEADDVIGDISFKIEAGKTTAFIGPTGSGKTTILNLIQGLYEVSAGEILINGVNLSGISREQIRDIFSYSTQRPLIFWDTVRNNIDVKKGTVSESRMNHAIRAACFDDVVSSLPDGLDTMMAQNGMNLSGGQRQRLTLARTVAQDAACYIFDDSFSALDARTEKASLREIRDMINGRTVIMVAQKIKTIKDADQIIVMDKGHIEGIGTHEQLLEQCRLYREIYETQEYLSSSGDKQP